MAKWYGDDLRHKLLRAYDHGEETLQQLGVRGWVQAQPELTVCGGKKVTPRQRTRNGSQPAAAPSLSGDDPKRLIFLDESGVTTQMTRAYARGQRVAEGAPQGHWKILTILSALSLRGLLATMTEEATDGDIFLTYLKQVLCPALHPGDVVVMDNLSAHKVSGVRELLQAAGAELLYLPPYSPDLNPIELAWAKLKQLLLRSKSEPLRRWNRRLRRLSLAMSYY